MVMIRLNRQMSLAGTLLIAGCSGRAIVSSAVSKATGAPNLSEYGQMGNVTFDDQTLLEQGTYKMTHAETYVFDRSKDSHVLGQLCAAGYDVRIASLRNPGGTLIIVDSRLHKPLASEDTTKISNIVTAAGAKFFGTKIPYRYGPDGKTPIAMASVITYGPDAASKIVQATATISFPSSQQAKSFSDYVDPNTYHVQVHGKEVKVHFKSQQGGIVDEQLYFQFLAKRLGGKFEYIDSGG